MQICRRSMKNGSISWKILNEKYPLHMKIGKRLINRQIRLRKKQLNMRKS